MAESSTRRAVLMSIRPAYANKLLSGLKRVEFRRSCPKAPIDRILVYATRPVGAVLGVLEVVGTDRAPPEKLWQDYGAVGGIEREAFFAYFAGANSGNAFIVGRVWRLESPLSLKEAGLDRRAPQSFRYVDSQLLSRIVTLPATPMTPTERVRRETLRSN